MSSTLARFTVLQKLLLETCARSRECSPGVFLTPVLPRRRLRHALGCLLDLVALLRDREVDREKSPGTGEAPPPVEIALLAAAAAAELAFLCHHPQRPAQAHVLDLMERLQGLPGALIPSAPREHAIECLWHFGGVASGLRHGSGSRVRRQALLAAGHLTLLAEVTGALDAALSQIDSTDDHVTLPELEAHV